MPVIGGKNRNSMHFYTWFHSRIIIGSYVTAYFVLPQRNGCKIKAKTVRRDLSSIKDRSTCSEVFSCWNELQNRKAKYLQEFGNITFILTGKFLTYVMSVNFDNFTLPTDKLVFWLVTDDWWQMTDDRLHRHWHTFMCCSWLFTRYLFHIW